MTPEQSARDAAELIHIYADAPDLQFTEKTILAAIRKVIEPIPTAYACQRCGRKDGLDAVVPIDVWEAICGPHNLLCLWCIDAKCQKQGIKTSASLHFCGKAITGTSQSHADREHISRLSKQLLDLEQEQAK